MTTILISVLVSVVCLIIIISVASKDNVSVAIFFGCIVIVSFVTTGVNIKKIGVEQGRMEVVTGKVKYELVTNPDSTRVWKEIKK